MIIKQFNLKDDIYYSVVHEFNKRRYLEGKGWLISRVVLETADICHHVSDSFRKVLCGPINLN